MARRMQQKVCLCGRTVRKVGVDQDNASIGATVTRSFTAGMASGRLAGPEPGLAVDQLPGDVQVTGMPRGLLDHVQHGVQPDGTTGRCHAASSSPATMESTASRWAARKASRAWVLGVLRLIADHVHPPAGRSLSLRSRSRARSLLARMLARLGSGRWIADVGGEVLVGRKC